MERNLNVNDKMEGKMERNLDVHHKVKSYFYNILYNNLYNNTFFFFLMSISLQYYLLHFTTMSEKDTKKKIVFYKLLYILFYE